MLRPKMSRLDFEFVPQGFMTFDRPNVVVIVTRLRAGQLGYWFYAEASFFCSPKHSVSGAHPASSSTGTEGFSPYAKRPGNVAHNFHLVARLRSWAIPLLPLCAFMASTGVAITPLQYKISWRSFQPMALFVERRRTDVSKRPRRLRMCQKGF